MNKLIDTACDILKKGGLVAIPTETVYGLGADASNPQAVEKIFKLKGRPTNHPLIVHIGNIEELSHWAKDIPDIAFTLAQHFWPGPLTLILPKADWVPLEVTGGQTSIGLRIPSHPVTLALLSQFKGGIAAPSANKFGHVSPTSAEHVKNEFGDDIDLILPGHICEVGIESTILNLTEIPPRILRPGMLSEVDLKKFIPDIQVTQSKISLQVSGSMDSHYAPYTKAYLKSFEALLEEDLSDVAVISLHKKLSVKAVKYWLELSSNPKQYAHDLYAALRNADQAGAKKIYIEMVPETQEWVAIQDRLSKACN